MNGGQWSGPWSEVFTSLGIPYDRPVGGARLEDTLDKRFPWDAAFGHHFAVEGLVGSEDAVREEWVEYDETFVGRLDKRFGFEVADDGCPELARGKYSPDTVKPGPSVSIGM